MSPSDPDELVRRRAALLAAGAGRSAEAERSELDAVTAELGRHLEGPATVRRITLEADEALARRLGDSEPVNPVRSEEDLRDRFDSDRRVFLLEHPGLPGHPMNVVWVALRQGTPGALGEVLAPGGEADDPAEADTAVFYSIWNVEPGLNGLGRGRELLEGAVTLLGDELPGLVTYVTLSPIPGMRAALGGPRGEEPADLLRAAARWLTDLSGGRPADPVARFHLGNGARLLRLCPGGDPSPRGIDRSWGVMANYRYAPEDRAANRAELARGRAVIGTEVAALMER